jgi:hypothetical protein
MDFSNYFGIVVWYVCLSLGIILLLLLGGMIVMFVESAMESYKDWVHPKLLIFYNQIYCWCEKACESICDSAKKTEKSQNTVPDKHNNSIKHRQQNFHIWWAIGL